MQKQVTFTMWGRPFVLTRDEVTRKHAGLASEHVREYAVEIGGTLFPVRKAMARALGVVNTEVGNTHQCVHVFNKLGFETRRVEPS